MRVSLIFFSRQGEILAEKMRSLLSQAEETEEVNVWCPPRLAGKSGLRPVENGLTSWCGERWKKDGLLVFIGACGIAVRGIAPQVRDKAADPAVLVVDEAGHFVISLLSGHLGGANKWAERIAKQLGAVPVITTGSDVQHALAVDVWAQSNHLSILSRQKAREAEAAILEGEEIGFFCDGTVTGPLPDGWKRVEDPRSSPDERFLIAVSVQDLRAGRPRVLSLVPQRCVALGIGCRRGQSAEVIQRKVRDWLAEADIAPESLGAVASLDIKKDEEGLSAFCRGWNLPLVTFSAEELGEVPGDFSSSPFVRSAVGVDNVCERAAVRASGGGRLILRRQAGEGVTAAAAVQRWGVTFA